MKIVMCIGSGANQIALASKINKIYPLHTLIFEKRTQKKKSILNFIKAIVDTLFFSAIKNSWKNMLKFYSDAKINSEKINKIETQDINSQNVYELIEQIEPDLIIVSGTSLIKKQLLSIKSRLGIINLHTGLSPYIKGGPNCTNWCIATNQFHLIGNTIMWIDAGIDSGNIILSDFTKFNGNETINDIHIKVMEHAHRLYLLAIAKITEGMAKNVKQKDIANGKTFYTREWNIKNKINFYRGMKRFNKEVNTKEYFEKQSKVTVIN